MKRRGGSSKDSKRMPADSEFYNKLVPIILIALAVLTVVLILFAAGVLLGLIHT